MIHVHEHVRVGIVGVRQTREDNNYGLTAICAWSWWSKALFEGIHLTLEFPSVVVNRTTFIVCSGCRCFLPLADLVVFQSI